MIVPSEEQLDALFAPLADPYAAAASVLLDKPEDKISRDERDLVKRVFMRVQAWRRAAELPCTGTLVHDEFTLCPLHDERRRP